MSALNDKITEILNNSAFSDFGVRVITHNPNGCIAAYRAGDELPNSYTWIDGLSTCEELEGVSAISISYDGWECEDIESDIKDLAPYLSLGDQIVLIGGAASYEGNDANEKVISNAEVLYVFK